MPNIVRKEMYVKSDIGNNNNKFWRFEQMSDNTVICYWGRVGDVGQNKSFRHNSEYEATKFIEKKIREKICNGRNDEVPYRKIDVVGNIGVSNEKIVVNSSLEKIAQSQIKKNNVIVDELIRYLTKVNVHNITSVSEGKITYNDTTGLFSTPLGIVTQENIDMANDILVKIGDIVVKRDYCDKKLVSLTNDYLMLVPQIIPRHGLILNEFWENAGKLQFQKQILDGLQSSYISSMTDKKDGQEIKANEAKVFDVELNTLDDKKLVKNIFDTYLKNRSSMHRESYRFAPKNIWSVKIEQSRENFLKDGAKMNNIISGYHGTSSANALSLLRSGLLVTPPKAAHISGKNYGNGIYSAPTMISGSSTKAANYCTAYWGGNRCERIFVFIVDMAMGNYYIPKKDTYLRIDYPVKGFDASWAKGGVSGVINDECIVYRSSQVDIKYLIELE